MDAVSRGDLSTAQRLVDAAAKAAGYDVEGWRGSTKQITASGIIDTSKGGIHFSEDKEEAKGYTLEGSSNIPSDESQLIHAHLRVGNTLDLRGVTSGRDLVRRFEKAGIPLDYKYDPSPWSQMSNHRKIPLSEILKEVGDNHGGNWSDFSANEEITDALTMNGKTPNVDSIAFFEHGNPDSTSWIISSPAQIKSADPVTYDDAGNVIPLSQRFNSRNEDIRNPRSRTTPKQFPYRYAAYLKAHFPAVWAAGGNIRGNDAFRWWTAYRRGDRSPAVMYWWETTRPAWITRHYGDYRLPGVIAQIKWGVIGNLGVAGMKRVVEDAVRRKL
jgi:hypothetical protein